MVYTTGRTITGNRQCAALRYSTGETHFFLQPNSKPSQTIMIINILRNKSKSAAVKDWLNESDTSFYRTQFKTFTNYHDY